MVIADPPATRHPPPVIARDHGAVQGAVQRMFEQINETLNRGLQASPLVNNRAGALADDVSQVR